MMRSVYLLTWLFCVVTGLKAFEVVSQNVTSLSNEPRANIPPSCYDIGSEDSDSAFFPGIPRVIRTILFRNSGQARISAASRGNWFRPTRIGSTWAPNRVNGPRPNNLPFQADHIFELHFLASWMNQRNLQPTYFGTHLPELKNILNGRGNMVYVPRDVNCLKKTITMSTMSNVLLNGVCQEPEISAAIAYLRAVGDDLRDVSTRVQQIIARISIGDAQHYETVMAIAMRCLLGS